MSSVYSAAPAVLSASSVSKSFATRSLLREVTLTVSPRERVGLVGPNGSGKTTLLKILAGMVAPDSGRVERSGPTVTVGYLPQETSAARDLTLYELIALRTGVGRAVQEMEASRARMNGALDSIQAYTDSVERYVALGGEDLEPRAHEMIDRLGLEAGLDRRLGSLSGGQRARAQLAGLLLARFDIFLLDEPTNDLDFAGLELIEEFVDANAGGMVLVSHDRAFLDRCVTSVLELDEVRGARSFAGGYDAFVREREVAEDARAKAYESYQAERKRLADEARRRMSNSRAGAARARRSPSDPDKFIRSGRIERAENAAT
ncbi:MAG: ATP-binding cassette domain-containing protein, partial [Actinomycetota bacterium]